MTAKVADFGESRRFDSVAAATRLEDEQGGRSSLTMTCAGTPMYAAPEVMRGDAYNMAADVFSFAVTVFEIVSNDHKYVRLQFRDGQGPVGIQQGWRPDLKHGLRTKLPGVLSLVRSCWAADPAERPSFKAIVSELASLRSGGSSPAVQELDCSR